MKKVLLLTLAGVMSASLAFGQTQVLSRNAVGYVKVDVLSNNLALCTLNFNAFDNHIGVVFTNQLTGGATFLASDQIIKWDVTNKAYIIYWKNTAGLWRRSGVTGGTTDTIEPGESFWIKNNHGSNQTVYLMGEVPDTLTAPTQELTIVTNLSMVSYGYPTEIAITNLNMPDAKGGATFLAADNIIKWNATGKTYITYWKSSSLGNWRKSGVSGLTTDTIQPGEGFWYKRLSNNFIWVESKPYTWP